MTPLPWCTQQPHLRLAGGNKWCAMRECQQRQQFWARSQLHCHVAVAIARLCGFTLANPAAAVHTSYAPLSSVAALAHRYRVQTPEGRTKTSRGRANSSRTRQMPRSCLIRQLPAPSHLRIQRQLCTHHTPHRAALLHPRIVIVYKPRRATRKQAAAERTARARGKCLGRA